MGRHLTFGRLVSSALLSAILALEATAQSITLVSKPYAPPTAGSGESSGIILSGDGKWAIFSSIADNIVTNDNNGIILDVFLKNLQTGEMVMVSRSPEGENLQDHSIGVFIATDGSKVVFESDSPELVEGDDNDAADIFIYNRLDGQITPIRAGVGEPGNGSSTYHASSADGRFILFASEASNLVETDLNKAGDLFLYNSQTGDLKLITQEHGGSGSAGGDPLGMSTEWIEGSVSGDGEHVVYTSYATNLVGVAVDGMNSQVYLRNVADGSNLLLSQSVAGLPGNGESSAPIISKDGTVVAFLSNADLAAPANPAPSLFLYEISSQELFPIPHPTELPFGFDLGAPVLSADGRYTAYRFGNHIYVWDRLMESNRLVSANSDGFPGNGPSDEPMISDDGRFIIFVSAATDFVSMNSFDSYQLFRFDQQSGAVELLSKDSSGTASTSDTLFPTMSENGLIVGFETLASNFEGAISNNLVDVFVVSEGHVALVSTSNSAAPSNTPNNGSSIQSGSLSWDGRKLVFTSLASDIVPNDTNSFPDLFLHELGRGEITLLSKGPDGTSANGRSDFGQISGDGRFVVFTSWATNLVSNDTNNAMDVFLLDLQANTTEMVSSPFEGIASGSSANNPAISADGRFVAYESTMAFGNTPAVFLRDVVARETTLVGVMGTPQWVMSPNGERIAYLSRDLTNSIYDRSTSAYSALPFRLISPQGFSDDGNRLLFVTDGTGTLPPFETRLMVFDFTSKESFVIATNSRSAAISPDGNYVFAETLTGPNAIVAIYNVNTGESELIYPVNGASNIGINSRPLFSADNLHVTFSSRSTNVITSEESSFSEVYLYNRVSGELVQLSRAASEEHHLSSSTDPIISRKGDQIYFMSSSPDLVAGDHNLAVDLFLYSVPEVDSDSDGLNDDWEMMRFGILGISPEGDEDGDGATNLSEYLAGTDPTSASSVLAVHSVEMIEGEVVIAWESVPGRRYQVQRKTFISENWNDIGAMVVAVSDEAATSFHYETAETQYFYQVSLVP